MDTTTMMKLGSAIKREAHLAALWAHSNELHVRLFTLITFLYC